MQIKPTDRIDQARADWGREHPDLDTSPLEVIGRVLRAAHLADARIRPVLRRAGLDRGAFDVLATLRRSGHPYRLTPTVLYQELVLTSGAMTHRVDALARAGLAERVPDPDDRRSSLVALTERGRAVVEEAMTAHLRCEAEMIATLSGGTRRHLAALLRELLLDMENHRTEAETWATTRS
jgi:DNA-binding MarR family transcriptional regulator